MRHLKRPTTATVIACVALFAALGGSAAAGRLITGKDIKDGSVTGKDIRNDSVGYADISAGLANLIDRPGPAGPAGPAGPQGPSGPSELGQVTVVQSGQVPFGASFVQGATAFCPGGQRAISGGGASISDEQVAADGPTNDRSGWFVIGVDLTDNGGEYVQATVLCAPTGKAVASSTLSRAKAREQVARLIEKVEASVGR